MLQSMGTRTYRLTVEGELDDHIQPAFPEMTLTRGHSTSTLTGPIRDQAELQAVLRRLSDFGLILLETKTLDEVPRQRRGAFPVSGSTTESR